MQVAHLCSWTLALYLKGKQGKWGKAPCVIHRNRALRLPALRVEIAPRQQAGASSCILSYLSTFPDRPGQP